MPDLTIKEQVEFVGSVVKVSTFTSKGGGFKVEVQVPMTEIASVEDVLKNLEKVAQFSIGFSSMGPKQYAEADQEDLFDDEETEA
jgi:hypothetical protein